MQHHLNAAYGTELKSEDLGVYGLGVLILAVIVGSLWHYIVGALAIIGAAHLYRESNRRNY